VKGKGKPTQKERGMGKGNGKGKGILKQTPGGDHISSALDFQLQKETFEADSNTEG
jgi:hypothetical protein